MESLKKENIWKKNTAEKEVRQAYKRLKAKLKTSLTASDNQITASTSEVSQSILAKNHSLKTSTKTPTPLALSTHSVAEQIFTVSHPVHKKVTDTPLTSNRVDDHLPTGERTPNRETSERQLQKVVTIGSQDIQSRTNNFKTLLTDWLRQKVESIPDGASTFVLTKNEAKVLNVLQEMLKDAKEALPSHKRQIEQMESSFNQNLDSVVMRY